MDDSVERFGKINKIYIAGFKSVKRQHLELTNLNILIGANGAGKSNFIGVFKLVYRIINRDLPLYVAQLGGADKFLHFGRKQTDKIQINLVFDNGYYECSLVPTVTDNLIVHNELCVPEAPNDEKQIVEFIARTGKIDPSTVSMQLAWYLRGWRVYHFHDTSDTAKVKARCPINNNIELFPDAENLAAMLYHFQNNDRYISAYRNIIEAIQIVAPFFHDFILVPQEGYILLRWKHRGTDNYFDASDLSDGTLRFICLATLLLQPDEFLPSTILLDEPELGLHPHAINILAEMMRSTAKRTQIIASTQSVPLVNQFSSDDIIVVDREEEASVFRRISQDEIAGWIDEYGLGDMWEKNIFGGSPK